MSEKSAELALQWLRKADHDLITARQTLLLEDPPTDTVCFHAQQAVEKALKALLTFHEVPFQRVHDLVRLLDFAVSYLPELETYRESFAEITNYAVEVRYPASWFDPPEADAREAMAVAEAAVACVRRAVTIPPPRGL